MNEEIGTRIVCAAVKLSNRKMKRTHILTGIRHHDFSMREQYGHLNFISPSFLEDDFTKEIQGFLTNEYDPTVNNYRFVTRTEAWKIAEAAGQIIRRCGGDDADGGTLYSENLY